MLSQIVNLGQIKGFHAKKNNGAIIKAEIFHHKN